MAVPAGSAATDKAHSGTPAWARKSTVVLLIAVLALAVFGSTTQTWLTVHLDPQQLGQGTAVRDGLQVQGSKAATTVTALALVALAGGLAASIAGKVARWVITGIIVLAAAGIIAAAATVLGDPLAAAQGSIAAATGVSGSTADVSVTAFPVLAVVAGSLLAVGGLLVVPAGKHWKTRTKYDTAAQGTTHQGSAGQGSTEQGTTRPGSPGAPAGPVDEIDSWDRLSRGDDPT